MRKLALIPILASVALLLLAAPAAALLLPQTPPGAGALDETEYFEEDVELEELDADEEEGCEFPGEEEGCEELEEAEERDAAEECIVEDARAKLIPRPGKGTIELVIRYRSFSPAAVAIEARLRGSRGRLRLGADRTRFRRSGVFRDRFRLGEGRMKRALAARRFQIELQPVNTPRYCRLNLEGAPRRAKRSLRAGGRGRSGGPGRTRGS